jgi:putative oxidoreductase
MSYGLLLLRLVGGLTISAHGVQKLFGWFGGHGLEATSGFFGNIGLRPGKRAATAAGASEALGGALLAAGFLTPVAQAMLTGVMAQAIRTVHLSKGPWNQDGGWEYPAVLIAVATALTDAGPGEWSLDHALGLNLKGPAWAAAALAAGVAGPSIMLRGAEEEEAPTPPSGRFVREEAEHPAPQPAQ